MSDCVICLRRPVERGLVCEPDRAWLERLPAQIAELYPDLAGALERGSAGGPKVSGSRERPIPLRLAPLDLSLPHHRRLPDGSPRPDSVLDVYGDQTGDIPVTTTLDLWVRDWAASREQWEQLPRPLVADLCAWLGLRTEWACDHHPAVDEYAAELRALLGRMRAALGLTEPGAELCSGVPCRRCDLMAVYLLPDSPYRECANEECRLLYSEEEWDAWTAELVDGLCGRRSVDGWYCAMPAGHGDGECAPAMKEAA